MSNSVVSERELRSQPHTGRAKKSSVIMYEIMHRERVVATYSTNGRCHIYDSEFMPYDLYFEEDDEIDDLVNNITNFNHWCASRVLSLDRKYAKELLNSIGAAQATTDKERAKISLLYHCVSLNDVYWVRESGEKVTFAEINLYDKSLNDAIVELSLKGRQLTVTNQELVSELAQDLSTKGCFPKAWIRGEKGFRLLKDGGEATVRRELLASEICQCFDIRQVIYREAFYEGELVSESNLITSKDYSMVSKLSFDIYACNHDLNTLEVCKAIDPVTYYGMNILDYLTGNVDRHAENWGFLVDNSNNRYISLYPLMDFNQTFLAYDRLEGASCLTVFPQHMTQREAAIEGVEQIGLRQIREMDMSKFGDLRKEAEMFQLRLDELKKYVNR